MGLNSEIKGVSESKFATAALYSAGIGLVLSDIIPTPADAAYFWAEKKLRDKWKNGEIRKKFNIFNIEKYHDNKKQI